VFLPGLAEPQKSKFSYEGTWLIAMSLFFCPYIGAGEDFGDFRLIAVSPASSYIALSIIYIDGIAIRSIYFRLRFIYTGKGGVRSTLFVPLILGRAIRSHQEGFAMFYRMIADPRGPMYRALG
jgi:hypothetical protein